MNNIFLSFCIIFFLLSCSPNSFEKGQSSSSSSLWDDDEWDDDSDEWNTDIGDQVKNICRKDQFIIYSPGECPETERTGNNSYDLIMGDINFGPDGSQSTEIDLNLNSPNVTRKPVDIFFVINASSSMWYYLGYVTDPHNKKFQNRFKSFIPTLNQHNMDWRMFFANSDYSGGFLNKRKNGRAMQLEGKYGILNSKVLSKNTKDYLNVFTYTITRGTGITREHGEPHECSIPPYCGNVRPLRALRGSFSANKNLTRDEADFVAVIVSNRDEEQEKVNPSDVVSEFRRVYGSHKRLFVLSLIILPGDSKCYDVNYDRTFFLFRRWQKPSYGDRISGLARKTGGGNFSICMDNYTILAKTIVSLMSSYQ